MKKYTLTKQELEQLNRIYSYVVQYQEITNMLNNNLKLFIMQGPMARVAIKPEEFDKIKVDFNEGVLLYDDGKKDKKENKKTEKQVKK